MYMTDDEVVGYYKKGGQTVRQIRIIAQLNACDVDDVIIILNKKGYKTPKINKEKPWSEDAEIPKSSIIINGRRYDKPFFMSEKYWQKYKQEIREIQIEREYNELKAHECDKQLQEITQFLKESEVGIYAKE